MLRNINDYLSFFSLIIVAIFSARFFIGSLLNVNDRRDSLSSRRSYLKDYINNEDD